MVDVTLPAAKAVPQVLSEDATGRRSQLLRNDFFGLERLENCEGLTLQPTPERFGILTAIEDGAIAWDGGEIPMPAGQTVMLPADGVPVRLTGKHFLLSYPQ